MSQHDINTMITLFIVFAFGMIFISSFTDRPQPTDPRKDCERDRYELKKRIATCADPEEMQILERNLKTFSRKKKYRRVEAPKGYSGELHAFIQMRKTDLN